MSKAIDCLSFVHAHDLVTASFTYICVYSMIVSQAARLSSACWSTAKVALEIRPFGYQDASPTEVDSFILYMTSQKRSVCPQWVYHLL